MHIAIIGAAGMVGRKLTAKLVADGVLSGEPIERLTLLDVVQPAAPEGFAGRVDARASDLSDEGEAEKIVAARPDVIFHLAAIVSGEAEVDFEKGYRINLDGTRLLFEAIRHANGEEGYNLTPLTSYGTQKAISELLLADYSRRGFFDGIGIRLPTICIRPGKPNRAASGFFSGILREPLIGMEAVLPVPESVRHWHASPRSAVGFLVHGATIDLAPLGVQRSLNMPGVSATVGEQIEALRRVAGEKAVKLIRREPDELVQRIVSGWAQGFEAKRSRELGFTAESSFDEIIRVHIDDELGGQLP
jgi:nucleoside-diphosphate-sugar epimerase